MAPYRRYCTIISCKHNRGIDDKEIRLFRTNTFEDIEKWKSVLSDLGVSHSGGKPTLCELHFYPDDISGGKLKRGAVPCFFPEEINEVEPIDVCEEFMEIGDDVINPVKMESSNFIEVASTSDNAKKKEANTPMKVSKSNYCTQCFDYSMKLMVLKAKHEQITRKYADLQDELRRLKRTLNYAKSRKPVTVNVPRPYKLNRCKVCFERVTDLNQHICLNRSEAKCEYCLATFESTLDLGFHLSDVKHPEMKLFKCSECSVGFSAALLLKFHQQSDLTHKSTNLSSSDKLLYECYICKEKFKYKRDIIFHIKLHVAARDKKCDVCNESLTSNELDLHLCDSEKSIKCEYCDRSFNVTIELLQHLENDHEHLLHACQKCFRFFGMEYLRSIHEKQHKDEIKRFGCDTCGKMFKSQTLLKAHKGRHSDERNYLCAECGKGFRDASLLKSHTDSHKEKTLECPDCPSKFRTQFQQKKHLEVHQDVKYKCSLCSRICPSRNSLKKHISKVHKDGLVKRFQCPDCPLKFSKNCKLKIHLRSHTGEKPFQCEHCDRRYAYKGDLTKHRQTHVGDNLYECESCDKAFRYYADLTKHSYEHYREEKLKQNSNNVNNSE